MAEAVPLKGSSAALVPCAKEDHMLDSVGHSFLEVRYVGRFNEGEGYGIGRLAFYLIRRVVSEPITVFGYQVEYKHLVLIISADYLPGKGTGIKTTEVDAEICVDAVEAKIDKAYGRGYVRVVMLSVSWRQREQFPADELRGLLSGWLLASGLGEGGLALGVAV
jgi:hypothetical protein